METFRILGLKRVLNLNEKDTKQVINRLKRIKDKIPQKSRAFFSLCGIDMSLITTKKELNGYLNYLGVMYYHKKKKSLYSKYKCLVRLAKR